ncbi:hypothetical protein pmac_cds_237 [Pandoravirus macleodensis]|uniref:Uncharacterized protein n=1 Tax=Pandoravirus macleodensis TaxID=2107707 RepID=A0A2U7UEZ0_9VIRU|nr:hypothetical protein pmac_cds_237 [Pandoravirus macleodensis]AVK76925.1 hypothetical protein pmac_cds_237 [Pandoravirus macleodensis]
MQQRRRVVPLARPMLAPSGGVTALADALGRMTVATRRALPPPRAVALPSVPGIEPAQGELQTTALVAAVQRPRDTRDDDVVTTLLSPAANAAFCPVESIETVQGRLRSVGPRARGEALGRSSLASTRDSVGVVYGRLLGAGTNARVYALERPATSADMEGGGGGLGGIDVPLAIKIPTAAVAVPGTTDSVYDFMRSLPCWDPRRQEYACPIEVETEALLSALASGLFTGGITPGTVVQARAFVCPGLASERPLCIIQERLGVAAPNAPVGTDTSTAYVSSVDRLPLFLDLVEGQPTGGLAGRIRRIETAAVEICISVLHTLAVVQVAFGLNVLDVRPANLLLKALEPGARYFRQEETAAASGFALAWRRPTVSAGDADGQSEADDSAVTDVFVLPNRGWLVKVADMGMAAAYAVARLEPVALGSRASVMTTVAVTTERSSERQDAALRRRASAARATYAAARERALASGASPQTAAARASEALSADEVRAINTFAQRLDERRTFGIQPRFVPGYDAHTLVASLADACLAWIGRVPAPIALLRDTLGYTVAPGAIRPALGAVSAYGPRAALATLHAAARASEGPAGAYMAAYLGSAERLSSPGLVVVEVPTGPVLLDAP